MTALRSPWRWLTAILLIGAAAAHMPVIAEHLREAYYMGVLFTAFTLAALVLAAAVLVFDAIVVYWLSAALCVAAIALYAVTRITALPELADDVGNWTEPLGLTAISVEFLAAVVCLMAPRRDEAANTVRMSP